MSRVFALAFFLTLMAASAFPATMKAPDTVTQGEFSKRLIEALGWSEGLPENPQEKDYLTILSGKRSFNFEAEDSFDQKNDPVAIRNFPLYGQFSGKGWLQAPNTRTAVHFRIFIPIDGKYSLKVSAKGDDQLWSIAGKAFKLDSGTAFRETALGEVNLTAGVLEFNAIIPPAGAIDSFALTAHDLHPVEPVNGWSFAAPLTAEVVNETVAALLNLEGQLPEDKEFSKKVIEASSAASLPPEAILTDSPIYGKPASANWVRFPQKGAIISLPFNSDKNAVYTLRARVLGTKLSAGFDTILAPATGKPYLDWVYAGTFRLDKGLHSANIQLPASGGIDTIEIGRKLLSADAYAALTKLNLPPRGGIDHTTVEAVLKTLQERFKERR